MVVDAARQGSLEEIFATGTAASVAPVASLTFRSERLRPSEVLPGPVTNDLFERLTGIQYGRLPDPHQWTRIVSG